MSRYKSETVTGIISLLRVKTQDAEVLERDNDKNGWSA